jgi:tetratricopeptide (TPR) repeat protein
MGRLVVFFVVVLLALQVLRQVPVIGGVFQIPLFGFWIAAILVAAVSSKLAATWVDRRKQRALERQLGTVDTPHNLGKLGALFVAQRRFGKALGYLARAIEGEPEVAEWHYRAGCALVGLGRYAEAVEALERCVAINEEYAYGGVLLRLAEALQGRGDPQLALEPLERFERNHGPNPESAYRRGVALRKLGRREEAREALALVGDLAGKMAGYQRKGAWTWVLRAQLARMG